MEDRLETLRVLGWMLVMNSPAVISIAAVTVYHLLRD